MYSSSGRPLCIMGNVVDSQGRESVKTILVQNGQIKTIQHGKVPLSLPDLILLELADDEVIFPGLINLHVHSEYNIFPLWQSPAVWSNRYQWRNNEQYLREIKSFKDYIESRWVNDYLGFVQPIVQSLTKEKAEPATAVSMASAISEIQKMYGVVTELQAVAGGTTLLQQTIKLENNGSLPSFIVRNTGAPQELGLPVTKKVFSVVDFVRPGPNFDPSGSPLQANDDTSGWPMMRHPSFDDFLQSVQNGNNRFYASIAHIAEGRSGYLQRGKPDGFSRREFTEFRKALAQLHNPEFLKTAHLTLTHACGLDYSDPTTLDFLRDNHISIVWSPVSNLILYRDTIPIKTLLDHGINVCLGSDWAPSGSKHVWDELKFARHFCDAVSLDISNAQLLAMVTRNPAEALGQAKAGAIETGYNADFFILRKQSARQPALDALLTEDDHSVRSTIVNGRIIYGDENLFVDTLAVDYQRIPATEGTAAAQKVVSINSALNIDLMKSLTQVDSLMHRFATETLQLPQLRRTRLLSSDDHFYQVRIKLVKTYLADLLK
ncbi:amidohydrolase family protein [Spirosoma sp. KCTC 42546]|uniref:amidohydrolase family protein n=1 Tax=Spirosoma sp. KCTC 42546 TaxID=2520506 RepID=UPI00115BD11A|nr:amidohydrolase family protein [Spirosoma sp. KCTC 42546]QDK81815.1 amidohydrolase family protein [Spirosoma sp. KCTC 42546]